MKDYCEIVLTFITMTNPMYRCTPCLSVFNTQNKPFEALDRQKACKTTRKQALPIYWNTDPMRGYPNIDTFKCIGNYHNSYWASIINLEDSYNKGVMPFNGSPMDQPAKIAEAFTLIYNLKRDKEETDQKALKGRVNGRASRR